MSTSNGTALDLINMIQRQAPEYLDLITARTCEEFATALDALIEQGVSHLEKNKDNYQALDEEGLSATLAAKMSVPGLDVSQEKHSGGHVDLTFEAIHSTPAWSALGEAKIYDGPAYHIKGLNQLLTRYTTGRECRGLLIEYVRKKDIKGLMDKVSGAMDDQLPEGQTGPTTGCALKWSFESTHAHSSGENVRVVHVGCNLFQNKAESPSE